MNRKRREGSIMKVWPHCWVPLGALLLLAAEGRADAPPPNLDQMLTSQPINAANWTKWAPRLREWSGQYYEAAAPAFQQAFRFIKGQQKDPTGARPGLPRNLEKDGVAWMVLAGAYLDDPRAGQSPVSAARAAADAARQSIKFEPNLARAHFLLCRALTAEQLTPLDKGGPTKPDAGKLRTALQELKAARERDPQARWMSPAEAGQLALKAQQWEDAEAFLRQAFQDNPGDVNTARQLARSITEAGRGVKRSEPHATSVKPLVDQFPQDGVLASYYARALALDRRNDEAFAQLAVARQLGTDPAKVIDPAMVKSLEDEHGRQVTADEKRKTEEDRRKAEETQRTERRKAEETRQAEQRKAEDDRRKAEAAARQRQMEEQAKRARAIPDALGTLFWWTFWFTLIYLSIMGLMCLAGMLLAKRTSGAGAVEMLGTPPEQLAASGQVARTSHETKLARFYLVGLLAALVLFYVSLPFLFVGLLLVFLFLVVAGMMMRRDAASGDVHQALLKASGGGMGALFKATFARTGSGGYGVDKDREDCPKLWTAIDEVARRVDTEGPDEVYISPGSDFGVHQEGRGPFGVFGGRKRVLTLGMCVMHCLTISELKAILAHEFAHFSHADTYWNRFVFQVTLSLRTAMREMARTGGWVTWVNPFYWFFYLYSKSYGMLSAGFSRSREYLADRMACSLYGSDVFVSGLRKVITDGSHFEGTVYGNIVRLLKDKKAFVNMYKAFRQYRDEGMTEAERKKLHKKLLKDEPSMYASHPTFQERMDAAKHLPQAKKTEGTPSLQLFEEPEKVEQELTDFLTAVVQRYVSA
jgi:Zn-dependent protease with chaperone function